MPIANNPRHLALLKRQAKAIRADKGANTWTFFVVVHRERKEALVHIDEKFEPEIFKNPRIIAKRIQRYKPLKPQTYAELFEDPKALVSCAGTVTADKAGTKLIFTRTVKTGKANRKDLNITFRLFKFLKGELGEADVEAPTESEQSVETKRLTGLARELFADTTPTAQVALDGLYEHLGSVDTLADTIEAVAEALAANPDDTDLRDMLDALQFAYDTLDEWDPEVGSLGIEDAMQELITSGLDDAEQEIIASALAQIREGWADTLKGLRGVLATIVPHMLETANSLDEDDDPEGLKAVAATKELEAMLFENVPGLVRHALEDEAADLDVNRKVLDSMLLSFTKAVSAVDDADDLHDFDTEVETDLAKRLTSGLQQGLDALVHLKRRLG